MTKPKSKPAFGLSNDESRYDDIISLQAPPIYGRQPMSREARAAQFTPYAALKGYDDIITEEAKKGENKA